MLNQNHANHEEFSVDYLEMAPRSRLCQPSVSGVGKDIEGLISYIVRVAAAHSVSPWRLLKKIYVVENPNIKEFMYPSFFNKYSSTINGLGKYAEIFVAETGTLTGSSLLRQTTLLPLANLLPTTGCGLLLGKPQWCPECINEMLISKNQSYRPLVWSLKLYRACTTHKKPLIDTCPHCNRIQPFIPRYPDLSRCAYCYQGLNFRNSDVGFEYSEFDYWIFTAIEDLITHLTELSHVATVEQLSAFIGTTIKHFSDGNRASFCKSIGLNSWAVKGWLAKNEKPSLPQLLSICYGIDILPSRIFLETSDKLLNKTHSIRCIPAKLIDRAERPLLTVKQRAILSSWVKNVAADDDDHRPLSEIAKVSGYTLSCLKYWFPAECAKILKKHADYKRKLGFINTQAAIRKISSIVSELQESGEYPSNRKVNNRILGLKMTLARPVLFKAYKLLLNKPQSNN